ncbi:MAG: SDR family NAD(P)-dependent oxidoreductase [Prevotella sp.]|nr:SDR family NAD(P)-dependent oxidoreductase [Prevotella sp.]
MKTAIVMGASSGIGHEVARQLLADGWTVGLCARRTAPLQQLLSANEGRGVVEQIDVTQTDASRQLKVLFERMGHVDLYLHVSGIGRQNLELDEDVELSTAETNALGFMRMVGEAFRQMERQGDGHIAVVSSIAITKGLGPAPAYSATKALQSTYVQALEQLSTSRRLNITFTDIRPGFVDTPLLASQKYPMLMPVEKVARSIVRAVALRRHVVVIDWRYRMLTFCWRCLPNCLWRNINLLRQKGHSQPADSQ